jgi:hypothetical protein
LDGSNAVSAGWAIDEIEVEEQDEKLMVTAKIAARNLFNVVNRMGYQVTVLVNKSR